MSMSEKKMNLPSSNNPELEGSSAAIEDILKRISSLEKEVKSLRGMVFLSMKKKK
jgi:hypothetical protein